MKSILFWPLCLLFAFGGYAQAQDGAATYDGALHQLVDWLEEGGNANARYQESNYSLLCLAVKGGKTEVVALLLKKGADVELESNQKTPLIYAAKYGQLDIARQLLAAGAQVDKRSSKGRTAYEYALKYEQAELAALLKQ